MSEPYDYINRTYRLDTGKGHRVEYTGEGRPKLGTIVGVDGAHLMIRMDGQKNAFPYHPTWELKHLGAPK